MGSALVAYRSATISATFLVAIGASFGGYDPSLSKQRWLHNRKN
jgi:hypothetical protein